MGLLRRALLLSVLLTVAGSARAADEKISPEAKRHVELGVAHYDAGRYSEAIAEFDLAYRLSHRPALLYNIARAEGKLGHDDAVIAFLRRYLEERPDAPDAPAVLAEIDARERAVANAQAKQQAEAEARAARKQAEALTQSDRARRDEEQRRRDAEAQQAHAVPAAAAPVAGEADRGRTLRHAGIALLVAGPALVAVGIGLGVLAKQSGDDVSRKMGDFAACCADLQSRGRASQAAGIALDVVGGAAAVAGATLLGLGYRKGSTNAFLAPTHNGVVAGGSF